MADSSISVHCVLLVDDEEADNYFHRRVLKRSGWVEHINVVNDGAQALDYIFGQGEYRDRTDTPRPNIIFPDINMPQMNGYEFL